MAQPHRSSRRRRRKRIALSVLIAGPVVAAGFLAWMVSGTAPPAPPPSPPKGAPATSASKPQAKSTSSSDDTLVTGSLEDPAIQALLASEPQEKRNAIILIDLYRQLLNRYPSTAELAGWAHTQSPDAQRLSALRQKKTSESGVANFIAGALMDAPAFISAVPSLTVDQPQDSLMAVGTMVARVIHYRDDIPREQDSGLALRLSTDFKLTEGKPNRIAPASTMLRGISGSSDIGEHFIEDRNDDATEIAAMRTYLRSGKLLIVNGNDVEESPRFILVFGFDRDGNLLVRDPLHKMATHVPPLFLIAFMRRPALSQDTSGAGFWLDMPRGPTRVRCVSHAPSPPPALEQPPLYLSWSEPKGVTSIISGAQVNLAPLRIPPGEHTVRGTLSLTATQIDTILHHAGSPATGAGEAFIQWGRYFNIDPIWALAFFRRESVFGTHPRWVGRKPAGGSTKNIGNIRYVGRANPQREPQYGEFNGFRDYATWEDGIHDWFKLLAQDSNYAGIHTVERIIPHYAPPSENDTDNYVQDVVRWVTEWREMSRRAGEVQLAAAKLPEVPSIPVEVECR